MMADADLKAAILDQVESRTFPDGSAFKGIGVAAVADLARTTGEPGAVIEIAALENKIIPLRYARNFNSFSFADQIVLLKSTAAVVGLGGLGGGVAEILARTGVGHLILIDGDKFEDSNLNRQLLSRTDRMGVAKVRAAAERIHQINPSVSTSVQVQFLTADNADELLAGANIVMDCLDAIWTRFTLESAAKAVGVPLVSAAVAGASGHATVIFPDDSGLSMVYGDPETAAKKGAEIDMGCLAPGVSLFSAVEAGEAIKILLGRKPSLRRRLLMVDLMENLMEIIALEK